MFLLGGVLTKFSLYLSLPSSSWIMNLFHMGIRWHVFVIGGSQYNYIAIQKWKREIFIPPQNLNHGPLQLKASVLPMSYTDPLLHERLYYMSSGSFDAVCKKKISQPVLTGLINNVLGIIFWACLFRSKNCHWCWYRKKAPNGPPKKCDELCSDPKGPKGQKDAKCQVSGTCNGAGCFESKLVICYWYTMTFP